MDFDGVIVGVQPKPNRNGTTRYEIAFQSEQGQQDVWTAFDGATGTFAMQNIGQPVSIRTEITSKGYKNIVDGGIAFKGQLPASAFPQPQQGQFPGFPQQQPQQQAAPNPALQGPVGQMFPEYQREHSPIEAARIARQNATNSAFVAVSNLFQGAGPEALEDFILKAKEVTKEILRFTMADPVPPQPVQPDPPPQTAPQTAEEVVAQVNQIAGAAAVTVGEVADW